MPARALAVVAALLLVLLSLGVTGSAFADPGSGKALGKDNGNDGGGSQAASSSAVADNGTAGDGSSEGTGNGAGNANANASDQGSGNGNAGAGQSNGNGSSGNANAGGQSSAPQAATASAAVSNGGSNNGQAKKQSSYVAPAKGNSAKGDSGKGQVKSNGPSKAQSHKTSGTDGTSGDVKQPQPLSNADQNQGGANGKCPGGPYCSTRDGSPSLNGNGHGKAVGKPCAGCVGKADNKNPKGQNPNGSDHNKGYECDGNNGIGKTNPAHTGCKASPPPCTVNCPPPPPGCVPKPGENENCKPIPCTPTSTQDKNCHEIPPCVMDPNAPGCVPPGYCQQHPDKCVPPPYYCTTYPDACPPQPDYCTTNPDACVPLPWCDLHPMSKACIPPPTIKGEEAILPRPPVVKGIEAFKPPVAKPAVAPAQAGALPNTGAEAGMGLAALGGFALLTVGVATLLLRRRTS